MTPEKAKELLPIIAAHANGEPIQYRWSYGWEVASDPSFADEPDRYRIAPKPKLRPWKEEEVPLGAAVRPKDAPAHRTLITQVYNNGVFRTGDTALYTPSEALEKLTLLDGTPCGVEEVQP